MINLLPDGRKDDIRAARANVIILRYTGIILLALLFLCGALYVSYTILQGTMKSNQDTISANDVKADVYHDTKAQVDSLQLQLTDAKSSLDQEVRYSKVLVDLGQLMPSDTILDNLTLTSADFTGVPIDIAVYGKSTASATAAQTNFQKSKLFTNVTMKSTETANVDGYTTKLTLTVVFNKAGISS